MNYDTETGSWLDDDCVLDDLGCPSELADLDEFSDDNMMGVRHPDVELTETELAVGDGRAEWIWAGPDNDIPF